MARAELDNGRKGTSASQACRYSEIGVIMPLVSCIFATAKGEALVIPITAGVALR
jgi:hypothetical protein